MPKLRFLGKFSLSNYRMVAKSEGAAIYMLTALPNKMIERNACSSSSVIEMCIKLCLLVCAFKITIAADAVSIRHWIKVCLTLFLFLF